MAEKKKIDKSKIASKIMAVFLLVLMILHYSYVLIIKYKKEGKKL